jgi:hypothetical protein
MPTTHIKCEKQCKENLGGFCYVWYARIHFGWRKKAIKLVTKVMECKWQQK